MTDVYVDGDACPVREEIYRVAVRLKVKVFVVSNGSRPIRPPGKPVTPLAPTAEKMNPPTTAPTMPRTMSRKKPSPCLFTILLAMNPAISPSMIHAMIDMTHLFAGIASRTNTREAVLVQFRTALARRGLIWRMLIEPRATGS